MADDDYPNLLELDEHLGEHITDTDPEYDNAVRAGLAVTAVKAYAERAKSVGEDAVTNITDLLGDLMHLCDVIGVDFDGLVGSAEYHYTPEREGKF